MSKQKLHQTNTRPANIYTYLLKSQKDGSYYIDQVGDFYAVEKYLQEKIGEDIEICW